jgi:hypothetical protein
MCVPPGLEQVDNQAIYYRLLANALRAALILALASACWLVYERLPKSNPVNAPNNSGPATVEIILRPPTSLDSVAKDIPVEISPIDMAAVRHEFNSEPRLGQRYDEFLHGRMKGRSPISVQLDQQGRGSAAIPPGEWWIHAVLAADEDIEWRLKITITGGPQTIELTPDNVYTRSKRF